MGTNWSAQFYAPSAVDAGEIQNQLISSFNTVIQEMSNWEPSSLVNAFNQLPENKSLTLPLGFAAVLSCALEIARQTDGAFNPCLGHLSGQLEFSEKPGAKGAVSDNQDWRKLEWCGGGAKLMQPGGIQLDLSAIAKGYTVDQMATLLEQQNVNSYLVEIGGEFKGRGAKADGQPWWVSIDSLMPDTEFVVALCGAALASSGSGHRVRQDVDGVVQHIVAKAEPQGLQSVTVIHENCMEADAWATALFAMGEHQGHEFAEANDLKALFQIEGKEPVLSNAMQQLLS